MNIKKILIKRAQALFGNLGYEFIPGWKVNEYLLANHLKNIFDKYRIEVVIDVGANLGQYHDLLRNDVGFTGKILSFEPVKNLADQIKARAATDNSWHIFNCALGQAAGEAEINVTKETALSSFLKPEANNLAGLWKKDAIVHVEKVQVRTLDEMLAEADINPEKKNVYLKLDTQGFDMEVLKGARNSIENIIALQTEASILPIYEGMPNFREMWDYLENLGYKISATIPVNHDHKLRLIEFDCVMINSRFT